MALLNTLMHHAARRGGLHVFGVYYRRLGAVAARALVPGLSCRRLNEEELRPFCADPELELREGMLSSGNACVGAFDGEELAGYVWFAYGDAPHLNGVRVRVPEQAIYRYKAFVRPAYRGRGIAPFLYGAADEMVARPGRSHVVNCVALQNTPSIAASLRSGDETLGHLGYWQAGRRFVAVHSREVQAFGLSFYLADSEAVVPAQAGTPFRK
jgi:GNAT superfamily N-acetyltransferase